jgi:hypothetical protein
MISDRGLKAVGGRQWAGSSDTGSGRTDRVVHCKPVELVSQEVSATPSPPLSANLRAFVRDEVQKRGASSSSNNWPHGARLSGRHTIGQREQRWAAEICPQFAQASEGRHTCGRFGPPAKGLGRKRIKLLRKYARKNITPSERTFREELMAFLDQSHIPYDPRHVGP